MRFPKGEITVPEARYLPGYDRLAAAYNGDDFEAIALLHGGGAPVLSMENFTIVFYGDQPGI